MNKCIFLNRLELLFQAVKKEMSGDFEFALLTILQCAENPGKFFAKVVNNSFLLKFVLPIEILKPAKMSYRFLRCGVLSPIKSEYYTFIRGIVCCTLS